MQLDGAGYGWMTRRLLDAAARGPSGRMAFLLEGGYDLLGLRESVAHTLDALGTAPESIDFGAVGARHEAEIEAAARQQRAFWRLG
jgi:acetoin utilization deacetylase AcuC-like enzyme